MPRKEITLKLDSRKLARTVDAEESQRLVQFSFRLPAGKRKALLDVARRNYGTSAQRLLNTAIDQIIADKPTLNQLRQF